MKKKNALCFVLIIFSCVVLLQISTMRAEEEPPDEIILDNKDYKSDRKDPVTLTHLNHMEDYEVACTECHHDYQEGKNVWEEGNPVKKCAACHDPVKNQEKIKKLSIAYHKNCKGCHRELARTGITKDAPYKKCTDCHEKKS